MFRYDPAKIPTLPILQQQRLLKRQKQCAVQRLDAPTPTTAMNAKPLTDSPTFSTSSSDSLPLTPSQRSSSLLQLQPEVVDAAMARRYSQQYCAQLIRGQLLHSAENRDNATPSKEEVRLVLQANPSLPSNSAAVISSTSVQWTNVNAFYSGTY